MARVPAAVWLSGLVAVSALLRIAVASTIAAPSIFPDEIIYSELAKSVATTGRFLVRDESFPALSYGPLYVVLIAPMYRIGSLPDAYAAVKIVNSILISLAAVPTYLIARRLLGRPLAYTAAVMSLLVPGMAFSVRIMTESLFYPVFLFAVLGMLRVLEDPTRRRQFEVLALIGVACAVRAQAVVLVPALATAILVDAAIEQRAGESRGFRDLFARLRVYRPTAAVLVLVGMLALVSLTLGGSTSSSGSGRASSVAGRFVPGHLPKWLLYQTAELDLALGVLPFAAFILFALPSLTSRARRCDRAFAAVTASTTVWMILLAAAWVSTKPEIMRVQERYVFYVGPLLLIGFLAWVSRARESRRPVAVVVALTAAAMPLVLPLGPLLTRRVLSSTPGLVPWLYLHSLWGSGLTYVGMAIVGTLAASALLLVRNRARLVTPVIAFLVLTSLVIWGGFASASSLAVRDGLGAGERAWVDDAVGTNADVAVLWTAQNPPTSRFRRVWETEFFNRSVGRVYYLHEPMVYDLPQTRVRLRGHAFVDAEGRPLTAEYVLADGVRVRGSVVATRPAVHLTLYRVEDGVVSIQ